MGVSKLESIQKGRISRLQKAASGEPVTSPPGSEDDDVDGCDVQVEVPTSDEDLPVAEGGVA